VSSVQILWLHPTPYTLHPNTRAVHNQVNVEYLKNTLLTLYRTGEVRRADSWAGTLY